MRRGGSLSKVPRGAGRPAPPLGDYYAVVLMGYQMITFVPASAMGLSFAVLVWSEPSCFGALSADRPFLACSRKGRPLG